MIRQLHLRTFMREKVSYLRMLARDAASSLAAWGPEEFSDEGPEELDDADIQEMIGSLEMMEADEGLWADPSALWVPRHAYAAMLQSSMDEYYRENHSVEPSDSVLGEQLRKDEPLVPANVLWSGSPTPGRGIRKFHLNKKDPRWVLVLYAKAIKRRRGPATFVDNSAQVAVFDGQARVVLLGDWGSGIPGAVKVAKEIWSSHLAPEIGRKDLHLVHLGDVYHAGLRADYRKHFLPHWPVGIGHEQDVTSWCLAGNHDMYSGGHGFFEMLQDVRFEKQNGSSYFLLENDDWQVFGLDTSFDPRDFRGDVGELYGEQAAWLAQKRAATPKKKCLILTHHQPFSAYESIVAHLERRLRPVCVRGQVDAWFWGHEHLCAVYSAYRDVRVPVLLGNGGFPERMKAQIASAPPVTYEWTATDPKGFLLFGFGVLDFDGDRIDVRVVDEDGNLQHQFTIT